MIWHREIDSYGRTKQEKGDAGFCSYLYPGQSLDSETGLAYNRFRYYDPESGNYISQDPIGLAGNNPTLYGYVSDPNSWVDVFGLDCQENRKIAKEKSEPEVRSRLEQKYPKEQFEILTEPRIYIDDGSGKYAKPDFMVIDRKTGDVVDLVDAKNGNANLTDNQIDLNTHGGTFNGSSRSSTLPKNSGPTKIESGSLRVERTNFLKKLIMNKFNDIKSFKNHFFKSLADFLEKDNYKYYSSKEIFLKTESEHRFNIFLYLYKRETFIEIETKIYYGNQNVEKKLKNIGIAVSNNTICGGDLDFVNCYYFKKNNDKKYSNIIYDLDTDADIVVKEWFFLYTKIIKIFFNDCTDPIILNSIVNDERIDIPGLNTTYETRVLKFYFVGELANIDSIVLEKKSQSYEKELRAFNAKYLEKFITLKKALIKSNNESIS